MWSAVAPMRGRAGRRLDHRLGSSCSRATALGLLVAVCACGCMVLRFSAEEILLAFLTVPARSSQHTVRAAAAEVAASPSWGASASPRPLELGATGWSGQRNEAPGVSMAAAAATPAVAAGVWMDCDVRFIAAEAHAAKIEQLKGEMQEAAAATDFERANQLKGRIERMSETGTPVAPAPESWLIGGEELFGTFGKFLNSRRLGPQDVDIDCETAADGQGTWGSRPCEECMKLHSGGPYGNTGVVTPAYPPQETASGCLALSQAVLDVDLDAYHSVRSTGSLGDENFDAEQDPSSIAFCRVK